MDRVAVLTPQDIVEAWVNPAEQRLSDQLNGGAPLVVRMDDGAGNPGAWETIHPDDVVAVVAPPRPGPHTHRMARRRHRMEVVAGRYRIEGTVHMPAGADPARYAARTAHHWLPLTSAHIATPDDEFEVEVLIVNLEHVRRADT